MTIATVIPNNRYRFSLGMQSAWGSAASNPDYRIPVYDGSDAGPMEERTELELIDGQAFRSGDYKNYGAADGEVEWASEASSLPRLFAAHFGSASDTVTGAGDPYTHTFTRKDTPLPHTMWVGRPKVGGTFEYDKLVDMICTTLEVRYAAGQLLRIGTTWLGGSAIGNATAPTPANTITIPNAGNYGHTWKGATIALDLATTPGATSFNKVTDFNITHAYADARMIQTENFGPDFYSSGIWSLGFSATMVLTNWDEYNVTFYGTASPGANTAQSSTVVAGAAVITIPQEPASGGRTVAGTINYMQFRVDGRPTPGADGDAITATLAGKLQVPTSGEPISWALKNATSSSYAA